MANKVVYRVICRDTKSILYFLTPQEAAWALFEDPKIVTIDMILADETSNEYKRAKDTSECDVKHFKKSQMFEQLFRHS
jgi:hypothetical protein